MAAREGGRDVVLAVSPAAAALGVRRGQTVAAARALCATLAVHRHDAPAERATLEEIARALLRYSPDVCLDGPSGVLVEIGRTAFHFGGEAATAMLLRRRLAEFGFHATIAVADTAAAARAAGRARHLGDDTVATSAVVHVPPGGSRAWLEPLPWTVIEPGAADAQTFRLLGLHTLGDLFRLPRSGLHSRFGAAFVGTLERLLGEHDEPLERFRPVDPFTAALEWWPASDDIGRACFAAKRLLGVLEDDLAARQEGLLVADAVFGIAGSKESVVVELRPSRPATSAAAVLRLLQHRLEAVGLPAPIDKLRLVCRVTVPLVTEQRSLFDTPGRAIGERAVDLCDRLTSRLGDDRVTSACLVAEHRPEYAYRWRRPLDSSPPGAVASPLGRRPLEIDAEPRRIDLDVTPEGRPVALHVRHDDGPLRSVIGPERIECGWWDGEDVRRRYFEIETPRGVRWWIFHDLADGRWYRHGVFL